MRLIAALVVAITSAPLAAQSSQVPDSVFVRQHYTKREVRIPVRDGVHLFTIIYTPRDASPANRYPILMMRTPFSVAPYGPDAYARTLGPNRFLMRDKYIFVYQDVRGRYMSEGDFENVRPFIPDSIKTRNRKVVDEASDTYDTIDWLLKNVPGHNGKVGQWGISYPGFFTSMGAVSRHPALVASSPQAPVTDLFFEDFHHNGAFVQATFAAYPIFGLPRPGPTTENWWLADFQKMLELGGSDDYGYQLSLGPLRNVTERFYSNNVFWREIVAHPNYDAFWRARAVPPVLRGVTHAVLVVGGWFDAEDLYGPLAVYKTLTARDPRAKTSIVMGPWRHRGWAAQDVVHTVHGDLYFGDSLETKYQRDVETPFFHTHLKGDGRADVPPALMFDTGRKRWERFARWPAPNAQARTYYFHADGSLSASAPREPRAYREYVSDPAKPVPSRCSGNTIEDGTLYQYMSDNQRCFISRPDVMTVQAETLREDVTFEGEIPGRSRSRAAGSRCSIAARSTTCRTSTRRRQSAS
jgi:hypothetical protein